LTCFTQCRIRGLELLDAAELGHVSQALSVLALLVLKCTCFTSTKAQTLTQAARGDVAQCTALLSGGAAVNFAGKSGATPLHKASAYGHLDAAQCLLERKADVHAADAGGETPLDAACKVLYLLY
jgi:ankyrin repeat protein